MLRHVGGDIVAKGVPEEEGIQRVFELNMGIYKIKFSMNLAMNFMYHAAVAIALGVGGLLAVQHRSRSARWWRSSRAWASSTTRGATW